MMKSKKRIVSMLTVLAMVLAMMPAMAFADTASETAEVYVTIADEGTLVMTQEKVTVSDIDADGALTINDALYAAHEAVFDGGAEAGYGSAMSSWGLSITKLWGDTSGAFGYCVNDASAWSLVDPVKAGDYVDAYIYKDQVAWSDSYSYFDKKVVEATAGESVELVLSYVGYDASWNKVANPAAGAVIIVDGTSTEFVTDAEGKVTLNLEEGTHVISAVSDSMILVPAVCVATVDAATVPDEPEVDGPVIDEDKTDDNITEEDSEDTVESETDTMDVDQEKEDVTTEGKTDSTPQTGDDFNMTLYGFIALGALAAAGFCLRRKTCK